MRGCLALSSGAFQTATPPFNAELTASLGHEPGDQALILSLRRALSSCNPRTPARHVSPDLEPPSKRGMALSGCEASQIIFNNRSGATDRTIERGTLTAGG